MGDRTVKKFCRIMGWVEAQDRPMADAIRDLCAEGQLSARQDGVTLLYPTEKVRKEFIKLAYGETPEKAVDILMAHIIGADLRTAAAFKGEIGSKLGVRLEAESTTATGVKLKGGAELQLAKSFKPLNRENMCVWEVKSGEVPLTGAEFRMPRPKRHTGGGDAAAAGARHAAMLACEDEYGAALASDRTTADRPYLRRVVSLLNSLAATHQDDLGRALAVLDRNPVASFYILFEPYKSAGEPFISDGAIQAWAKSVEAGQGEVAQPAATLLSAFEKGRAVATRATAAGRDGQPVPAGVFARADAVQQAIDAEIAEIMPDKLSIALLAHLQAKYAEYARANAVGAVDAVWPSVMGSPDAAARKLWQDLLRFDLRSVQANLQKGGDIATALSIHTNLVGTAYRGTDYAGDVTSRFAPAGKVGIDVEAVRLAEFVKSRDYCYVPRPADLVTATAGGDPEENPLTRETSNVERRSHWALQQHAHREQAVRPATALFEAFAD